MRSRRVISSHGEGAMWKIEDWIISGVHTGYRVVKRGPRGALEINSGFSFSIYEAGSRERAKADAETRRDELNKSYESENVIQLFPKF